MTPPAIDLDALRRLSVSERLQLVEDLWDSIATETPDEALPLTPELTAELDRRIEDVRAGRERTVSWPDLRKRILDGTLRAP